jgi:Flp pilus assembly pilin Flp
MRQLARLFKEQDGMETVEYAVVAGILVGGTIVAITAIAGLVQSRFEELQTQLEG